MKSILVYGPSGCGKTKNSKKILKHYGLKQVYDGAGSIEEVTSRPFNTLIITNDESMARWLKTKNIVKVVKFSSAMLGLRKRSKL